jgi:hypothetical protein
MEQEILEEGKFYVQFNLPNIFDIYLYVDTIMLFTCGSYLLTGSFGCLDRLSFLLIILVQISFWVFCHLQENYYDVARRFVFSFQFS